MNKRLTMKQMADELGLSRMTVSSVVNGRARELGYAHKTIQKVQNYLEEKGYVPSRYATELRPDQTKVIGLLHFGKLFSHLTDAFNLLIEELTISGWRLEIVVVPLPEFVSGIRELIARRVSEIVWIHNGRIGEDYRREEIKGFLSNVRTIIYNYGFGEWGSEQELLERGFHLVGANRLRDAAKLASFLHELGHRRIALPGVNLKAKDRRFADKFLESGLEICPCWEGLLPRDQESAVKCASEVKTVMGNDGVTAAVFLGDEAACRVIMEFSQMGVQVPKDISVIGFDGVSRKWVYRPELTTLRIPVSEMVERVRCIIDGEYRSREHCFELELLERKTHGPSILHGEEY